MLFNTYAIDCSCFQACKLKQVQLELASESQVYWHVDQNHLSFNVLSPILKLKFKKKQIIQFWTPASF